MTRLDPWTVYGDSAAPEQRAVDVPDIGVLPPAGRYRGRIRSGFGTAPAILVVPALTDAGRSAGYRRITIEACDLPDEAGTSVAITFEAIG